MQRFLTSNISRFSHSFRDFVAEAHRLQARVEQRECVDSMSGERFEATVGVELDGQRYRGCGFVP